MFQNPSDEDLRAVLARARTIVVMGLSPRPERPSHRIARLLKAWGYRVIPVRPALREVLGEKAYPRLADVPEKIDLVDIFRAAEEAGPIVEQCIALGLPAIGSSRVSSTRRPPSVRARRGCSWSWIAASRSITAA